jgi:outer membrane protein OmpA-like peptidoglycan-associated protein
MRSTMTVLALALFSVAGAAYAADPAPAFSPEDFARALKEAPCPEGQVRDNGGECRADVSSTRGFNLGVPAKHMRRAPGGGESGGGGARTSTAPNPLDDLRITFRSGSAEMTTEGEAEAKSFATALTMPWLSKRRFEIAGHTDASGSKKKNLALSQARAENVVSFLVANGVDPSRLEAKGYGSERLAAPDKPRDAVNRRVEARSLN